LVEQAADLGPEKLLGCARLRLLGGLTVRHAAAEPSFIGALLDVRWLWPLARLVLCSAYLLGGVSKALDFQAATAEQAHFGLELGWLWAAVAIVVELVGSVLVISGRLVWLGAGALGVLTAVATLTANAFWRVQGPERAMVANSFFEHLGLIAGFVLVALNAHRRPD
jgi:uncharacterized membrane protein YphA (DoxX/SURF4 family)